MRDPYEVLGVPREASPANIKSAFRKLAKKLHPDANKSDPKTAARFSELNAAYEIIGDAAKRKAFDRGEIDAEGKPRFQGFERAHPGGGGQEGGFETFTWGPQGAQRGRGGGGNFRGFGGVDDILKDMLGGFGGGGRGRAGGGFHFEADDFAGAAPGRDVTATLTIALGEVAKGGTRRVHLPTGKEVEVRIPIGISDGQQIRLKGQGLAGPRGSAGDALITVTVARHPLFEREGANLRIDLPITLDEAVLGGKVRVPTIDGAVDLAIPPDTSSGRIFRAKGKGLPSKQGQGDLLVTVRIALPEGGDRELEELMRKWRAQKPYDPRRDMS